VAESDGETFLMLLQEWLSVGA